MKMAIIDLSMFQSNDVYQYQVQIPDFNECIIPLADPKQKCNHLRFSKYVQVYEFNKEEPHYFEANVNFDKDEIPAFKNIKNIDIFVSKGRKKYQNGYLGRYLKNNNFKRYSDEDRQDPVTLVNTWKNGVGKMYQKYIKSSHKTRTFNIGAGSYSSVKNKRAEHSSFNNFQDSQSSIKITKSETVTKEKLSLVVKKPNKRFSNIQFVSTCRPISMCSNDHHLFGSTKKIKALKITNFSLIEKNDLLNRVESVMSERNLKPFRQCSAHKL